MNDSLFMNILLLVCMYPILLIVYYILKNAALKDHTLFGIRFSDEWLSKEDVENLKKEYQRSLKRYLLILAFLPFLSFLIPFFSISITLWMVWLFAVLVLIFIPFAQGNRKMKVLKAERSGLSGQDGDVRYTELKSLGAIRTIRWFDFLPATLLSLGIAIYSLVGLRTQRYAEFSYVIVIYALCTPLFWLIAHCMDKMKTSVISTNSDVNVNYTRADKLLWKNVWMVCSWANTLCTALIFLSVLLETDGVLSPGALILWGSVLMCLVLMCFGMYATKKERKLSKHYAAYKDLPDEDNERYWIGGMIYNNPHDRHTMVPKSIGIGTTVNIATPVGKICMGITALALLFIPLSCVWAMLEEFTPISLSLQNSEIVATQIKTDYRIPVDSITDMELVHEIPKSRRTNGTGMDHLLKGTFRNSEDGKVQFFLNPNNHDFLRIEADDVIYYLSGYDDAETLEIYENIYSK